MKIKAALHHLILKSHQSKQESILLCLKSWEKNKENGTIT